MNFPTKKHWRAVPPLGAGNGGLDWADVRPRIEAALSETKGVDVQLYVPEGAPAAAEMKPRTASPLTLGRADVLVAHPDTRERIARVLAAADGFDSMYGMELLATVHWAATRDIDRPDDLDGVVRRVQSWNRRKHDLFTERHVHIAWEHLRDEGWLAA